jgi:hypothetical protein
MPIDIRTTVLVAADSQDLVDLATARDELAIVASDTSHDTSLARYIKQCSAVIAKYCNRVFPVESVLDVLRPAEDPYRYRRAIDDSLLQLSRWPLANAQPVTFTGSISANNVLITAASNTAGLQSGMLIFADCLPEATLVKEVSPYTVLLGTAASSAATQASFTAGLQVIQTIDSSTTRTLVYGDDFDVDEDCGWLIRIDQRYGRRRAWERYPTSVRYQAGYAEIPDDLQMACLRLVTERFRGRGRDPLLVQREQPGLASERWWVGPTPGQHGALPPEIESLLSQYRVPVNA